MRIETVAERVVENDGDAVLAQGTAALIAEPASFLINLGIVEFDQSDYEAARARLEEGLAIRRKLGTGRGIAKALDNLGAVAKACGDQQSAWAMFEEGLASCRALGDRWGLSMSLATLGSIASERADDPVARALHEESLAIRRELDDRRGIAESLEGLACVAFALGRPGRAARIRNATERLREEIGVPPPMDRAAYGIRCRPCAPPWPMTQPSIWPGSRVARWR